MSQDVNKYELPTINSKDFHIDDLLSSDDFT